MSNITTRSGLSRPLTHRELDDNFTNLNNDKLESLSQDTNPSLSARLDANGNVIANVPTPVELDHATNKAYVDDSSATTLSTANTYTDTEIATRAENGANTDITSLSGLTGGVATVDYVDLNQNTSTLPIPGRMVWNPDHTCISIGLNNEVTLDVGQELLIKVRNVTGATIPNGAVVRVVGASSQTLTVEPASALFNVSSDTTIAIATQEIANNQTGFVTTAGIVRDVNTLAYPEGTVLWLSETPGQFTSTRPQFPSKSVLVGFVVRSHGTVGQVFVQVKTSADFTNLDDVSAESPQSNDVIRWDSTNNVWVNTAYTALFDQSFVLKTTSDLVEGDNLYYTNSRARDAISASGDISYDPNTGVISYVTPGNISAFANDVGYLTDISSQSINTLSDVNTAGITNGQVLQYNDITGQFEPGNTTVNETDPIFTASPSYTITNTNIGNWNTAYSWGDHSTSGYLTSETDPIFTASPAGSITSTNITNWNTAYSWGDHSTAGYALQSNIGQPNGIAGLDSAGKVPAGQLPSYVDDVIEASSYATLPAVGEVGKIYVTTDTNKAYRWSGTTYFELSAFNETDPVFTASPASGITSTNITNWNTAYSWGDHATSGYLTSETDPVFTASPAGGITAAQISNWSTAYSWGDHASENYLKDIVGQSIDSLSDVSTTGISDGETLVWNSSVQRLEPGTQATNLGALTDVAYIGTPTNGSMLTHNGTNWTDLPAGPAGSFLTVNGVGNLQWETVNLSGITEVAEDTTPSLGGDLNASGYRITNLGTPLLLSDAVTKEYVDTQLGGGGFNGDLSGNTLTDSINNKVSIDVPLEVQTTSTFGITAKDPGSGLAAAFYHVRPNEGGANIVLRTARDANSVTGQPSNVYDIRASIDDIPIGSTTTPNFNVNHAHRCNLYHPDFSMWTTVNKSSQYSTNGFWNHNSASQTFTMSNAATFMGFPVNQHDYYHAAYVFNDNDSAFYQLAEYNTKSIFRRTITEFEPTVSTFNYESGAWLEAVNPESMLMFWNQGFGISWTHEVFIKIPSWHGSPSVEVYNITPPRDGSIQNPYGGSSYVSYANIPSWYNTGTRKATLTRPTTGYDIYRIKIEYFGSDFTVKEWDIQHYD
jgi:hypothetical protein